MLRKLIAVSIMLFVISGCCCLPEAPPDPALAGVTGFRDMVLGSSFDASLGLVEVPEDERALVVPGTTEYVLADEELELGEARLKAVYYRYLTKEGILVNTTVAALDAECKILSEMLAAKYDRKFEWIQSMKGEAVEITWLWQRDVCVLQYDLRSAKGTLKKYEDAAGAAQAKSRRDQADGL